MGECGMYPGFAGIVAELKAMVLIVCRYYGKSLPSGSEGKKTKQYLTTEQALADYAEFISGLKYQLNATNSPVVGFGGSYGKC